jgi:hypothetical protein
MGNAIVESNIKASDCSRARQVKKHLQEFRFSTQLAISFAKTA